MGKGGLAGTRALLEQALDVSHRVLGEEHPNTLSSTSGLAETLKAQGELAGASAPHEQALDARRRRYLRPARVAGDLLHHRSHWRPSRHLRDLRCVP